jgi:predicted transcriptional regulator
MKRTLNPIEQRILTAMIENTGFHSTREIAELSGVSWNTAEKYLQQFLKNKWIEHYKSGNRDYWKATPPKGELNE